jgi:hypothetical protein
MAPARTTRNTRRGRRPSRTRYRPARGTATRYRSRRARPRSRIRAGGSRVGLRCRLRPAARDARERATAPDIAGPVLARRLRRGDGPRRGGDRLAGETGPGREGSDYREHHRNPSMRCCQLAQYGFSVLLLAVRFPSRGSLPDVTSPSQTTKSRVRKRRSSRSRKSNERLGNEQPTRRPNASSPSSRKRSLTVSRRPRAGDRSHAVAIVSRAPTGRCFFAIATTAEPRCWARKQTPDRALVLA